MRLAYLPTERLGSIPEEPISNVRAVQTEQSNSTALVDEKFVVKIYRKLENGINPEVEVGRFLTDVAGFANTPALLGSVELTGPDTQAAVAIVHAFVGNQGDAWTVTSAALDRFVDEQRLVGASDSAPVLEEKAVYQRYMTQTGKRVARNAGCAGQPRRHRGFPSRNGDAFGRRKPHRSSDGARRPNVRPPCASQASGIGSTSC